MSDPSGHKTTTDRIRFCAWAVTCLLMEALSLGATAVLQVDRDWAATMAVAHAEFAGKPAELARAASAAFPLETDWLLQDCNGNLSVFLNQPAAQMPESYPWMAKARTDLARLRGDPEPVPPSRPEAQKKAALENALRRYTGVCAERRRQRLESLYRNCPRILYVRRHPVTPSFFAYTEGQSDAQRERHFRPGAELRLLQLGPDGSRETTLLQDPHGVIRNPAVSYDAKRILFAWKKADRTDDYHLYDMQTDGTDLRQLTHGLGFADYEPAYPPNDDIVFSSTRCVQTVDCWWTEVSNLYICGPDGRYMRRVGFDQVHTICPHVLRDGTVIYTRWDYNDRGQVWPQGLFQMNPDGSAQREFYGNNSYFPTTITHARAIPNSRNVIAIATGHHTWQAGKLIEIDPARGRQEARGITMLAPRRAANPVRIDRYGQNGDLFRQPYPLDRETFLVCFVPDNLNRGRQSVFGLYWMNADGDRELLAEPGKVSCNAPVPLRPRTRPPVKPTIVDYRKTTGHLYLQDVYHGPGLAGIERGTVRKLRIVALSYRAAGIDSNRNRGPAGGALVSTPVSIDNGAWDVKTVLGDTRVYADGSAFFTVPARTPVYIQAIDKNGHAVQTMRSWTTLQPGETQSCTGCHESQNEAPLNDRPTTIAMKTGPKTLEPFYGPPRGFSYIKEVQPVWDRHCVRCHGAAAKDREHAKPSASHCWKNDTVSAICDGAIPLNSDDHSIPRHTWWSRKGGTEWVQVTFDTPRQIGACALYWFDDRPRNGGCRVPESWNVLYLDGDRWRNTRHGGETGGVEQNGFNILHFEPVRTAALRVQVALRNEKSGGVLEWIWGHDETELQKKINPRIELAGIQKPGPGGRKWSASYLCLTRSGRANDLVNWISAQSVPTMLPPYHKGAARSRLIKMLDDGHHNVTLNREERDKIACWIDLLVPYCGSYTEANAWTGKQIETYRHFMQKRSRMERIEARHIEALVKQRNGSDVCLDFGYTNLALNPFDQIECTGTLPHATSNRGNSPNPWRAPANVIDGRTENQGHGARFPSWEPEKQNEAWLKIDLGKPRKINRIDLWIRADFPHDSYWKSARITFSDGSAETVDIRNTPECQSVHLAEKTVRWIRFDHLEPEDPEKPCAFSEIAIWGQRSGP